MEGGDGDRETHTHSKDRQMKEMEMMRGKRKVRRAGRRTEKAKSDHLWRLLKHQTL